MLPIELSLEQQANYRIYETQVTHLSREQCQDMLLSSLLQLMLKDNVIRHLLKNTIL